MAKKKDLFGTPKESDEYHEPPQIGEAQEGESQEQKMTSEIKRKLPRSWKKTKGLKQ